MDALAKNRSQRDYYRSILDRYKGELQKALPGHISADRFIQVALITITKKPHLFRCTKASIIGAVMTAASIGLYIDDDLGECFIDMAHNDLTKKWEAQIIIGYQGLSTLAIRSGFVSDLIPRYVCEGDIFDFEYGLDEKLQHKPLGNDRSNDKITHFYIIVKMTSGSKIFNVMTRSEVDESRDRSPHYKQATDKTTTVWHQYYNKMGNKTVLRSIAKYIPLSPEMSIAIKLDESLEYGIQDLSSSIVELPDLPEDVAQEAAEVAEVKNNSKSAEKAKNKRDVKVKAALDDLNNILTKKTK